MRTYGREPGPSKPGQPVQPGLGSQGHAGLWYRCLSKNTPFLRAFALQLSSRHFSPAPDLVLFRLIVPRVFFSGGVFLLTDTSITFRVVRVNYMRNLLGWLETRLAQILLVLRVGREVDGLLHTLFLQQLSALRPRLG